MAIVKRALLLSTGERYLTLVTNFLTLAIVSRILSPAEIGVSVIGMAIIGVAMALREFASATFLIQQRELTREDIRAAFSVILALTVLISMSLAVAAPLLADVFDETGLVPYLRIISVCILIDTFATQVTSLLRREMAFGRVAAINVSSAATAAAVTIALALQGFSFMSFAWGWFAASIVASAVALAFRPHFWMFRPSLQRARAMIRFGGYNGATYLLFMLVEHLPYILLGRIASLEAAAMYNRAMAITQLPDKVFIGGAVPVILPAFAAESREGRNVKKAYLHALEIITVLQWPALVVLCLLAYPVVDVVLGAQWHAAAGLVQIFAIASLFSFSFAVNDPVLMAIGAVRDVFIRATIVFPVAVTAITLAAFLGGLEATALSMLFVFPFRAYVSLAFVKRRLSISWAEIATCVRQSAVVAASSLLGPLAVVVLAGTHSQLSLVQTAAAVILAAAGWLAGARMTGHPVFAEIASAVARVTKIGSAVPAGDNPPGHLVPGRDPS